MMNKTVGSRIRRALYGAEQPSPSPPSRPSKLYEFVSCTPTSSASSSSAESPMKSTMTFYKKKEQQTSVPLLPLLDDIRASRSRTRMRQQEQPEKLLPNAANRENRPTLKSGKNIMSKEKAAPPKPRAIPASKKHVRNADKDRFKIVTVAVPRASCDGDVPLADYSNRKFFKSGGFVTKTIKVTVGRHTWRQSSKQASHTTEKHGEKSNEDTVLSKSPVPSPRSLELPALSPLSSPSPASSSVSVNSNDFSATDTTDQQPAVINKPTKPKWPIKYNPKAAALTQKTKESVKRMSPATASTKKKKRVDGDAKEQTIIDAGQRNIGPTVCDECGMLYAKNDPEDVVIHAKLHNTVHNNLKFKGWKKENVISEFDDGRVILVTSKDPKYAQNKVDDVLEVVNNNLGFYQHPQPNRDQSKVYLFVSTEKKIVGCAMAETIDKAYRLVVDERGPPCCSTEPQAAACGVNRIWTAATHRRRRIASRLVDCIRQSFYFGYVVSADRLAFSDPTPDGRRFAESYVGTQTFLVYN